MTRNMVQEAGVDSRTPGGSASNSAARAGAKGARTQLNKMLKGGYDEQDVALLYAHLRAACKQRGGFRRSIDEAKIDDDADTTAQTPKEILDAINDTLGTAGLPTEADRPVLRNLVLRLHEQI